MRAILSVVIIIISLTANLHPQKFEIETIENEFDKTITVSGKNNKLTSLTAINKTIKGSKEYGIYLEPFFIYDFRKQNITTIGFLIVHITNSDDACFNAINDILLSVDSKYSIYQKTKKMFPRKIGSYYNYKIKGKKYVMESAAITVTIDHYIILMKAKNITALITGGDNSLMFNNSSIDKNFYDNISTFSKEIIKYIRLMD